MRKSEKDTPVKVVMLVWSFWPGHEGGAERQCRKLLPYLKEQGVDCEVWTARTHRKHLRKEPYRHGVIHRLGFSVPFFCGVTARLERCVSKAVREPGAGSDGSSARMRESLHFWLRLPFVWAARLDFLFALKRRLKKCPPELLHVHESLWLAGAAVYLAKPYQVPVVAKTANFPALKPLGYDVPFRGKFSRARSGCRYIAMAPFLKTSLVDSGVPENQISVIPNGVQLPALSDTPKVPGRVLFVANFSQSVEEKAFDTLLQAWARVQARRKEASLVLLGDGDSTPWKQMAEQLGVSDSVQFTGWVGDPSDYFNTSEIFVLPSREEGMSNALLEAQSWGLAPVVSDIPANLAVVTHGENGWVFPVDDAEKMAGAVCHLLEHAPLRKKLGSRARSRMEENHSLETVAVRMKDLYVLLSKEKGQG